MSGSGGVSIARARGENRFYNPPAIRQRQQLEQQKRQQKEQEQSRPKPSPATSAKTPTPSPPSSVESDKRTETATATTMATIVAVSEDCASSLCSTNLDRFLESTTPLVPAQYLPKKSLRQWRAREPESSPYFVLGDLWESYGEWSVYGAGVPLLLNGSDSVVQYYVPYLSGIQLYVDPSKPSPRLRKDESDAESSRETSSDGSSNYERGRRAVAHGTWAQKNVPVPNVNGWKEISDKSKPSMGSSSDESETSNPPGRLVFEYMERDTPYSREPLCDKITVLAAQFPELRTYRSCDLSPSSWISVAWYPIYRIPTGPTLQNLEACFLTFPSLSTPCQSTSTEGMNSIGGRARRAHTRLSLPIFGLASYKFKVPFWNNDKVDESQKASSLLRAADNWLRLLQVHHPDYSFFVSHHIPRR